MQVKPAAMVLSLVRIQMIQHTPVYFGVLFAPRRIKDLSYLWSTRMRVILTILATKGWRKIIQWLFVDTISTIPRPTRYPIYTQLRLLERTKISCLRKVNLYDDQVK